MIPILRNPSIEAFIDSIIISENTFDNLQIICDILNKFVSGELYTSYTKNSSCFTPFNWYFIEKSEMLYKIYENSSKVRLPTFIEDFINNKLPSDFEYDYFQQNKDEAINFRSICFNIREAYILINLTEKCKSQIFINSEMQFLEKTFNHLTSKSSQQIMRDIINKENNIEEQNKTENDNKSNKSRNNSVNSVDIENYKPKKKIYYFLFTSLAINEENNKLFEISQNSKSFSLPEIKDLSNESNVIKNNIIKVKNFICSLLYNFDKLVKTNFEPGSIENTEKILEELNMLMKSSYFVMDGTIPFDWYINSIFEYLQKIPSNLIKNDCEELYKEIEKDINDSIAQLDFVKLSEILSKLDFAERWKIFYKENQTLLMDIILKEEVKKIINDEFIPVTIKFSCPDCVNGVFKIEPSTFKEKDKENIEKIQEHQILKGASLIFTIKEFIRKFPNLRYYQDFDDVDIFDLQDKLNLQKNMEIYFDFIFANLEHNKNLQNKFLEFNKIKENIIDYIMSKLYDKIFPSEPDQKDLTFLQQSLKFSWVKPNHLLGNKKQYVFGSFLKDMENTIKHLEIEKSIRKKLLIIDDLYNNMNFFYSFNGKKEIGVDDIVPILTYALINIHPITLYSNFKYMKIYSKIGKFWVEGSKLQQIESAIELIIHLTYNNLIGITEKEFYEELNKNSK